MPRLLRAIHGSLDLMQRRLWFKIALSVTVLAGCAAYFSVLLTRTYSLNSQRMALYQALINQNLTKRDEHAVSLSERGEVFINGRTYGGPSIKALRTSWFDDQGNITSIPVLVERFVQDQIPQWAPNWLLESPSTSQLLAGVTIVWFLLIIWMEITLPFVLTVLGTGLAVFASPVIASMFGVDKSQIQLAVAGMGLLTFTFVLLTRTSLLILNWPYQALSVAHTLVKEAARSRVSLVFIVALLVILPLLPLGLDPANPLRFRVQTYISRSVGFTFAIAACMTLFLSCATVAFEIRDRQIWQLMTKPVTHINYLIGKWIGVMAVNLNILVVAGVSTFTFIQYLSTLPVAGGTEGMMDAIAVRDEILTARSSRHPDYERLDEAQLSQRLDQLFANDPNYAGKTDIPAFERRKKAAEIQNQFNAGQRTVPPGPQGARLYTFTGLKDAAKLNSTLTLRYRFHIMRDDEHQKFPARFVFADKEENFITDRMSSFVPTMSHSMVIDSGMIQDDGTLRIGIENLYQPPPENRGYGALNFEEKDFELFYKVGNFEGNFLRAVLMSWLKLAFLAALGICCATFLSFPVACLASFTIFIAGLLGPFLAQALEYYGSYEFKTLDWSNVGMVIQWAFEAFTSTVAGALVYLLGSFGEYRPTQDLVEGRLIAWQSVFSGFFRLALLWSGLSLIVGWLVMRKRQLAIYSGHG